MKRVTYKCSICNQEQETTEWRFKRKKTTFCQKCVSTGTQKGIRKPQFSGENSGRWGGGEYISTDGYKMVKVEGEFHTSGRQKYKREHTIVYEKFLGRELKTTRGYNGEQIHHIDGDKLNNNLDNLLLCANLAEHQLVHAQLEEIAYDLIKKGVINFNKKTNKYELNESRIN